MKTKYNRFAIIPFQCTDCYRYVWFERYRKEEIYRPISPSVSSFITRKICNECMSKYDISERQGVIE